MSEGKIGKHVLVLIFITMDRRGLPCGKPEPATKSFHAAE